MICQEWASGPAKLLIINVFVAAFIVGYPVPSASVFSDGPQPQPVMQESFGSPMAPIPDPAVRSMEAFLGRYGVDESHLSRVAESIVRSAKDYDLDPRLIASIMIVESGANPFAISGSDAIGIMQVHLPTWGPTADQEGVNLFKIEDNVAFGCRILKDYVDQFGLWEGVKRYKGWIADDPESELGAEAYVTKVQRLYGVQRPIPTASLLQ
jgi:soluble lytic murein transglycosylase-like protein